MKRLIYGVLFAVLTLSGFVLAQDQPTGHVSGLMFGDYFYNVARDSSFATGHGTPATKATSGAKDLNGFNFRRIYFTYDDDI
ncbi:MAG TPA: hypothetical protein VKS81_08650, partial [Bacteroidota bacterium]|nr:hypothetical protein [Bacteroidota bacterium]